MAEMSQREHDLREAYKICFSGEAGKKVLEDLIAAHYIGRSTYESATDSPNIVAYREGGKNAVLRILSYAGKRLVATE